MSPPLPLEEKSALILRRTEEACDVYLYNAPLQNANSSGRNLLSSVSSSTRSKYRDSWNKHWLVILHYGEELVYVCDSGADQTGTLKGHGYWQDWTIVQGNDYSYKANDPPIALQELNVWHLGKYKIPKALAKKVVKDMHDSGKYHVTNNNCQKWAKELLRRLGVKEPQDIPDAQTVYENAKPSVIAVILGAVLVVFFGIGYSIFRTRC
ncbi:hypothetical protein HPB52_019448 [Rhipicephalus sanguineus]|uniref:Uncharacterized protein n=1 Tax=Rhipicephalus sanguineus TaxID=34632 RepID=A0A9D4PXB9_RHISA|nr:hypothetical protein HPB52_019448 [Rhipicephalus sanguineus]